MEIKKFTQSGIFLIVIMLPLFLIITTILFKVGFARPETPVLLILSIIILICLLTFYKLTIIIDNTHLTLKLGIGLFAKSYKLSDIKNCKPVKNPAYFGIGIWMLTDGWLYNVSGQSAIELTFYNMKSVVRIGTDKAQEICNLMLHLTGRNIYEEEMVSDSRNHLSSFWVVIAAIIIIPGTMIVVGTRETKVLLQNEEMIIQGFYGLTIPLADIDQVDTISIFPGIYIRTNGYEFGKTYAGNFRLTDQSDAKMFIKRGFPPYIIIRSKNRVPVYLNFKNNNKTRILFSKLRTVE